MATGVQTWSQTAATNASADSNINWAEGMAPSQVNDSARAEMASVAKWRDDNNGTLATSGTSAAFTVTTNQVESALTAGYTVAVQFHATADTSATLNVDGLGAKPLQIYAGTNFSGGEFVAGSIGHFTYSSTGTGQWIGKSMNQLATHSVTLPKLGTTGGNPPFGFDVPINLQINASVGSNLLTIAIKTNSGSDPSAADPIYIPFRDTTLTSGDPVWRSVTSALSISTNAVGATLATQNNVPFRFWLLAFDNSGTVVLSLWHSGAGASTTALKPLNEAALQSTTAISGSATSAGVFYTPNGTTLASKAFRIIGYVDYTSGLGTAGTYNAAPDIVQLFGPGIKKPGDVVQSGFNNNASGAASVAITPSSAINLVKVTSTGWASIANSSALLSGTVQLKRGASAIQTITLATQGGASGGNLDLPFSHVQLDAPATSSSVTYSNVANTLSMGAASLLAEEVMG